MAKKANEASEAPKTANETLNSVKRNLETFEQQRGTVIIMENPNQVVEGIVTHKEGREIGKDDKIKTLELLNPETGILQLIPMVSVIENAYSELSAKYGGDYFYMKATYIGKQQNADKTRTYHNFNFQHGELNGDDLEVLKSFEENYK